MQFSKIFFTAILALSQTVVAAPSAYTDAAAQQYVGYLNQYILEHPGLTPDQKTAINNMVDLASNVDRIDAETEAALLEEATEVFGHDEAMALLAPKTKRSAAKMVNGKRAYECDCADASAYCNTGWECKKHHADCDESSWGCGFAGVYSCDGMCIG